MARERVPRPVRRPEADGAPHSKASKADQAECDRCTSGDELHELLHLRARRLPSQPADNAAVAVSERVGGARRARHFDFETQPPQARSPLQDANQLRVDIAKVRRDHLQRLDCGIQKLPVAGFEIVVGAMLQHKGDRGTGSSGDAHEHGRRRVDARDRRSMPHAAEKRQKPCAEHLPTDNCLRGDTAKMHRNTPGRPARRKPNEYG